MGFRSSVLQFRGLGGVGLRVLVSKVWGLGVWALKVSGLGFRCKFRVLGLKVLGLKVQGLGFRVLGLKV